MSGKHVTRSAARPTRLSLRWVGCDLVLTITLARLVLAFCWHSESRSKATRLARLEMLATALLGPSEPIVSGSPVNGQTATRTASGYRADGWPSGY